MRLKTYVEDPRHRMEKTFLPKEVYATVVAAMVIVCADALIVDRAHKQVYLAKRRIRPMRGWWMMGGRVLPGEDFTDAIVRKFAQETGLVLLPERFLPIGFQRYQWKDREQEPCHLGSDNLVMQHVVDLSPGERRIVSERLSADEYEPGVGLFEFNRGRLLEEQVHPAIVDLYDEIFPH